MLVDDRTFTQALWTKNEFNSLTNCGFPGIVST